MWRRLWFSYYNALFHLVDGSVEQNPLGIGWPSKRWADRSRFICCSVGRALDPTRRRVRIRYGQIERSDTTADGLGEVLIFHLRVDREGALWASTEGGLSRIRYGHVVTLISMNGLPCHANHWSAEDADHSVWVYLGMCIGACGRPPR